MKINSTNNLNFGKKAILSCKVKERRTSQKLNATLYSFSSNNPNDLYEVNNSNLPSGFKKDFSNPFISPHIKFYALKLDNSSEFVSSSEIGRHYTPNFDECGNILNKHRGTNTVIEELNTNPKFIGGKTPILAKIAKDANDKNDKFIFTSFTTDEIPDMKNYSFSKSKFGNWIMPKNRYENFISRAEKNSSIEYFS